MTLVDLKRAIIALLKENFPNHNFYSGARVEAINRPAFFTRLTASSDIPANYHTRHANYVLTIDYFQNEGDEVDGLETMQKIRDIFGLYLYVECENAGSRIVYVGEWSYEYIGQSKNVLQGSVNLEWFNRIDHPDNADTMESITVDYKYKED